MGEAMGPVSAVGATAGAVLLLATPARVFSGIVPFLVATASIVLLVQPLLSSWYDRRRSERDGVIRPHPSRWSGNGGSTDTEDRGE